MPRLSNRMEGYVAGVASSRVLALDLSQRYGSLLGIDMFLRVAFIAIYMTVPAPMSTS